MNNYMYDDISIGHTETFSQTINSEKMSLFSEITGDRNPLHIEKRICYGMLTASLLSTLAGMYIPGERALIHSVEIEFPTPLLVDEEQTVTVCGVVLRKESRFKLLVLKVTITDKDGRKILRGKMNVGVRDE